MARARQGRRSSPRWIEWTVMVIVALVAPAVRGQSSADPFDDGPTMEAGQPDLLILPSGQAPPAELHWAAPAVAPSDSPSGPARATDAVRTTPDDGRAPGELLQEAYDLATTAKTSDDYSRVIELCERADSRAASADSQAYARRLLSWAHNRRGELWADQGVEQQALADFEAAVSLDRSRWRAVHNRGVSYAMQGNYQQALQDFTHTIQLNPKYANAYFNRAELYFNMGNLQTAIDDYTKAIQLAPDDAAAYNSRGYAWFRLEQYQQATQDYTTALRLNPNLAAAFVNRGDLYRDLGYYENALTDYQSAIRVEPDFARGHYSLGWLLATCPDEQFRDPAASMRFLAKAQELEQTSGSQTADADTLDAIGAAYAAAGDFEQAKKYVEQAIFAAPDEAEPFQARLSLYQQNQPFVITPTGAPPATDAAPTAEQPALQSAAGQAPPRSAQPARTIRRTPRPALTSPRAMPSPFSTPHR